MDAVTDPDGRAIVALLDQAIHAEARTDAPPEAEQRDWLYGGVDPTTYTEPDAHGWMGIVPPSTVGWVPRALVFWHTVLASGGSISREQMRQPAHSLSRWPTIEIAVGDYLTASPWLIA
ncbi:hypothetical protein HL653_23920 (plasmid) [Sphingomonas sp. AP4-R1]|uniref:hypothetical protein n=1 Tax=Sphingomonas sp. AP4-R1 TaxID=2735134 RepID=UPI0014939C00|nr:hypothetical protein [Sphingomonas sp. AP4-R1]QJU60961.1 hypothetical protein HL653_23920 [Sphingomonas sp. AP4-R1]